MIQQHSHRDTFFASSSEFRPDQGNRGIKIKRASIRKQMRGECGFSFRAGENNGDGVVLPGCCCLRVCYATPEVNNGFASNRYADSRALLAGLFEILSEYLINLSLIHI